MELLELQDQVVVQEQMDQVDLVLPQDHQVIMVHLERQGQVELVDQVVVMVQKVHQLQVVQVLHQQVQEHQQAQDLLVHLVVQELLAIDIEHLLRVN
jgi:hypothetical protein